jgi:hypothetical protein
MTGFENLQLIARLFGLDGRAARSASAELLERLGLGDAGDCLVRTYSGGMRRRLDLGASLVEEVLAAVAADTPRSDLDTQRASAPVDGGAGELAAVVRLLDERGIAIDDIGLRRPTLDEVFLALTGQHLVPSDRDDAAQQRADAA